MSLEEVRSRARLFQKRIRRRNIREYSVMVFAIVYIPTLMVFFKAFPLIQIALGLCVAGTLVIAYQFRKRMSSRSFPTDAASMTCLEFYRSELERQRDANLSIWSWYILPMLPGATMMIIGMAFMPSLGPIVSLILIVLFTVGFILTGIANKRAARRLQQKIHELRN